jgi:hypothetical protein
MVIKPIAQLKLKISANIVFYPFLFLILVSTFCTTARAALAVKEACRPNEEWTISVNGLAPNAPLYQYLKWAPRDISESLNKWRALKNVQSDSAKYPELQGAVLYWYYRAAFQLGLYSFAENGFEEVLKKLGDGTQVGVSQNIYGLASKMCLKVIKQKFQGLTPKSPFIVHYNQDLNFFKALADPDLNKSSRMFQFLYDEAVRKNQKSRSTSLVLLYAQELLRRGKYVEVEKITKKITAKNEKFPDALLVRAWAAFLSKDYSHAVGHSYSLMKSFGNTFEAIEAEYIAIAGFLEVCMDQDAQKTLEYYKTQVLTLDQWLRSQSALVKRNPYTYYVSKIQDESVPAGIRREWLRNGQIFEDQGRLNSTEDELKKVNSWRNDRRFTQVPEIEKRVRLAQIAAKQKLAATFLAEFTKNQAQIEEWIENGQLIETDILAVQGQKGTAPDKKMTENSKPSSDGEETKVSITKKSIWSRSSFNTGKGVPKEEIWLDDIGNYVGNFKNLCKH